MQHIQDGSNRASVLFLNPVAICHILLLASYHSGLESCAHVLDVGQRNPALGNEELSNAVKGEQVQRVVDGLVQANLKYVE